MADKIKTQILFSVILFSKSVPPMG